MHINSNTGNENAPVIDLYTAENSVIAGRKVRLVCHSYSRRRPEFTWLRDGRQFEPQQQQQQQERDENDYNDSQRLVAPNSFLASVCALFHLIGCFTGVHANLGIHMN